MIYEVLVDTDVLIWYIRGNEKAYKLINDLESFCISSITYMELVQGMKNKDELKILQRALKQWNAKVIYVNEEISARALFYVEEFFLSHSMQIADSLIASTCMQFGMKLITSTDKHYKIVKDLEIQIFRP